MTPFSFGRPSFSESFKVLVMAQQAQPFFQSSLSKAKKKKLFICLYSPLQWV
jgi:hypothetical protein